MAGNRRSRPMNTLKSSGWKTAHAAGRLTEKAAVGLFRWMTTDHIGSSDALRHIPATSFGEALKYALLQILCAVVVALVTGVWIFVLMAFVLPFLLSVAFS